MSRVNREAEMSDPVSAWLLKRGYEVYAEVPFYDRRIDLAGINWETKEICIVELKCQLSHQVRHQCHINQLVTDRVFAAVSTRPRDKTIHEHLEQGAGFGLLFVAPDGVVSELCEVTERRNGSFASRHHAERMLEHCKMIEPGGVAGLPSGKGQGPAQDVHRRIMKFTAENPSVDWDTIFVSVNHHYQHRQSLAGSMRILERDGKVDRRIIVKHDRTRLVVSNRDPE